MVSHGLQYMLLSKVSWDLLWLCSGLASHIKPLKVIPKSACLQLADMSFNAKQHPEIMFTVFVSKEEAASVRLQAEYTACLWSGSRVYLSRRGCILHASELGQVLGGVVCF